MVELFFCPHVKTMTAYLHLEQQSYFGSEKDAKDLEHIIE